MEAVADQAFKEKKSGKKSTIIQNIGRSIHTVLFANPVIYDLENYSHDVMMTFDFFGTRYSLRSKKLRMVTKYVNCDRMFIAAIRIHELVMIQTGGFPDLVKTPFLGALVHFKRVLTDTLLLCRILHF